MRDAERDRVNLHSVLNCLISLWACEIGGKGQREGGGVRVGGGGRRAGAQHI